jgi:hypothetical protein
VNVQPTQRDLAPYGAAVKANPVNSYVRVEHAEFPFVRNPIGGCKISVRALQRATLSRPGTISDEPGIPTLFWNGSQSDVGASRRITGPCGYHSQAERKAAGCNVIDPECDLQKLGAKPDDFVCWAQLFVYAHDDQAIAYFRTTSGGFRPHPPYATPPSHWVAGDHCIDCNYWRNSTRGPIHIAPNWLPYVSTNSEGTCKHCDRD